MTQQQEQILVALQEARAQNDSFGLRTHGPEDKLFPDLETLEKGGFVEVEHCPDGSSWWRARKLA